MLPVFLRSIDDMEESFDACQYVCDHTECFMKFLYKLGRGVKGRLILDKKNVAESSCARQAARLAEMWNAGCELRVLRPAGGCYPCMHAKTLIFDKRVVLTGSVNMTHSGFENNKEHLFRIDTPSTVLDVYEDFLETWGASQKVDQTMIDEMMVASEKAKDKRRQKNVARSLSAEIDREGRVPRQEGGRRS